MIAEYVFRSKYARYKKNEQRRESWGEAVDRMMDMHLKTFPSLNEEIEECRQAMKEKRITGSQRALQFGGDAVLEKNLRLYNCVSSYADRPRFFAESLWLLLCGCGVGFSVQSHHIEKLPSIQEPAYPAPYYIRDSIEGWADAVNVLFNAYFHGKNQPYFDFSGIRPKGAELRFGGYAPGPEPLKKALGKIEDLLRLRMDERLRSIDVFDCVMHLADSVLSAGIRRAATIATFDIDDELMLNAKVGDWFVENPQRGRANISAVLTPNTPQEKFNRLFESTKEFGEPGVIFLENEELTVNPCVEIVMCPMYITHQGQPVDNYTSELVDHRNRKMWEDNGYTFESGWQACNLSTINASKLNSAQDLKDASRLAAIMGTMQSAYTEVGYLREASRKIIQRESLLGVSLCGVMDAPSICLDPQALQDGAAEVLRVNEEIARRIGIPKASRTTCVKPEGTSSIVLESSSGVHPHHAKRYLRRVNANLDEPIFRAFYEENPQAVEDSVWGADKVVAFAIEAPKDALIKSDLSAVEFMSKSKIVYENWVVPGTRPNRLEGATHNVSITVTVQPLEWEGVQSYLWENRDSFCGVSFLGASGDYDYPQAPLQAVSEPIEESTEAEIDAWNLWQNLKSTVKPVDYEQVIEAEDTTSGIENVACQYGVCEII
jgi:ribonucleoside-diphosphate reductase alpha chain